MIPARKTLLMKSRLSIALGVCLYGLLLPGTVTAGEIYKFVDADGNVHYGDRPSGDPEEERLQIATRATDPATVQAEIDRRRARDAVREERRVLRENQKQEAREERAAREQLAQRCEEQRKRLKSYTESQRLYRRDENGERVYLDGPEREKTEAALRQEIETTCS
jgi:hypothetical protein